MRSKTNLKREDVIYLQSNTLYYVQFVHKMFVACIFTLVIVLLCSSMSFADTVVKSKADHSAWELTAFEGFISKADYDMLYSLAGGLIYESSLESPSPVTMDIDGSPDDTTFSDWKLHDESSDGHLAHVFSMLVR